MAKNPSESTIVDFTWVACHADTWVPGSAGVTRP